MRKRPADASLTNQQGPKSTSKPGSTITVLQRLTGCRIQCDRAHLNPLSFSAQLPILVSEFKWNCLLGNTVNALASLGHLGHRTLEWFLISHKRLFLQTFSPTYQVILLIIPSSRNMAIALQSQRKEFNSI